MKRFSFKTIVSGILAVTVIVMVAVCCCALKPAVAAVKMCSHCKSQQPVDQKADHKSPECCLTKLAPFESAAQSFVLKVSIDKISYLVTHAVEFAFAPAKVKFNLAYLDGPPGIVDALPIYLINKQFRI